MKTMSSIELRIELLKALNRTLELAQSGAASSRLANERTELYKALECDLIKYIRLCTWSKTEIEAAEIKAAVFSCCAGGHGSGSPMPPVGCSLDSFPLHGRGAKHRELAAEYEPGDGETRGRPWIADAIEGTEHPTP